MGKGQLADFFALQPRGQPEIQHLYPPSRRYHHVGAFEVAMHDSAVMRVRQSIGNLRTVARHRVHREARRGDHIAERSPLNQFHHHVEIVAGLSHLVNGANVRMAQGRGGLGLAEQMVGANLVKRTVERATLVRHRGSAPHPARGKLHPYRLCQSVRGFCNDPASARSWLPLNAILSRPLSRARRLRHVPTVHGHAAANSSRMRTANA